MMFFQISQNINIKIPEEGEKIKRLVELAKERNIDYKPSAEAMASLSSYIDRKGIPTPLDPNIGNSQPVQPPVYNPPPPNDHNNFPPGPGGSFPPHGF